MIRRQEATTRVVPPGLLNNRQFLMSQTNGPSLAAILMCFIAMLVAVSIMTSVIGGVYAHWLVVVPATFVAAWSVQSLSRNV